ncbi:MAG: sulfite exporter TauE/SafE family protein [Pseudomonadota bacterium]
MDNLFLPCTLLGALVGLILALTGAGGSVLAVPLMLFILHLNVAEAAPIALLAVALSAAVGAAIGLRAGIVRYRAAGVMATAGIACAPIGLWLAQRLPNAPLTLLFALVLAIVAWRMFGQAAAGAPPPAQQPPCMLDPATGHFAWCARCLRALLATGAGAGFLSGLLGVGGGFVIVPALRRASNAPGQAIVATSLAVITFVSSAGVMSTVIAGRMNWRLGLPFAFGAVLGMLGGRRLATRLSGPRLQQTFAVVAGLVAISMVLKVSIGT